MLSMNRCIGTVARMGGVPAILAEFVDSYADLIQWNSQYLCGPGEHVFYPRPPKVSIHDVARNILADTMRGDWLLMLDTDHEFEPDLAARLINLADSCQVDVVTGLYQYRSPPHSPVLYRYEGEGLRPLGDWDPAATALEIDSAGAGCLLVRRKVFDAIRRELDEAPFDRIKGYGEDHSFFLRLKKLDIRTACNPSIECHHLQVRPLSLEDYDRESVELNEPKMVRGYR